MLNSLFEAQAWILDRDGTLVSHVPYLHKPGEVRLLPGVREALFKAKQCRIRLFIYTNQSGIRRGYYGWHSFDRTQEQIYRQLGMTLSDFTEVCGAPEAPGETPVFRKPHGRFINDVLKKYSLQASQCAMIGDSWVDVETAHLNALLPVALGTGEPHLKANDPRFKTLPQFRFYRDWKELLQKNGC